MKFQTNSVLIHSLDTFHYICPLYSLIPRAPYNSLYKFEFSYTWYAPLVSKSKNEDEPITQLHSIAWFKKSLGSIPLPQVQGLRGSCPPEETRWRFFVHRHFIGL